MYSMLSSRLSVDFCFQQRSLVEFTSSTASVLSNTYSYLTTRLLYYQYLPWHICCHFYCHIIQAYYWHRKTVNCVWILSCVNAQRLGILEYCFFLNLRCTSLMQDLCSRWYSIVIHILLHLKFVVTTSCSIKKFTEIVFFDFVSVTATAFKISINLPIQHKSGCYHLLAARAKSPIYIPRLTRRRSVLGVYDHN